MWDVYFSGAPAGISPRLVADRIAVQVEAVAMARRLTDSYQRVSPFPNGYYYVVASAPHASSV